MLRISEPLPGVRIITLPLPFELNHVNVALVSLPSGYLLIDTGMDTEESFSVLSASLSSIGVSWRSIKTILVTHMHPDHIGLLPRLLKLTGAKLMMHRAEAAQLNAVVAAGRPPWIDAGLAIAGAPHSVSVAIHHSLQHLRDALQAVEPDVLLEGGEEIPTAIGPAHIVWTPGHSVGHVCVYWPQRRALYSGDHLIEKITPNIAWMPERDCLGEYLESLAKLVPYEIDIVQPSHGEPFSAHTQWIARTTAHHAARCDEIRRHLSVKPRTAHELAPELWDQHLTPFHYHFALFEVLAHLEYMARQGSIQAVPAAGGAVAWSLGS